MLISKLMGRIPEGLNSLVTEHLLSPEISALHPNHLFQFQVLQLWVALVVNYYMLTIAFLGSIQSIIHHPNPLEKRCSFQ